MNTPTHSRFNQPNKHLHPLAYTYLVDLLSNDHHLLLHNDNTDNWLITCRAQCDDKEIASAHCQQLENLNLIAINELITYGEYLLDERYLVFEPTLNALEFLSEQLPLAQLFLEREANLCNTYTTNHLTILNELDNQNAKTNNTPLLYSFMLLKTAQGALHRNPNGRWRFTYNYYGLPSAPVRDAIATALITAGFLTRNESLDEQLPNHEHTQAYALTQLGNELASDLAADIIQPRDARLNVTHFLYWQLKSSYEWTQHVPEFNNKSPQLDLSDPETILYWLTVHTTFNPQATQRDPGLSTLITTFRNTITNTNDEHLAHGIQTAAHTNTLNHLMNLH